MDSKAIEVLLEQEGHQIGHGAAFVGRVKNQGFVGYPGDRDSDTNGLAGLAGRHGRRKGEGEK